MINYRTLPNPIPCSFDDFNKHLEEAINSNIYVCYGNITNFIPNTLIIEEKENLFKLLYKVNNEKRYYVIERNGNNEDLNLADTHSIWAQFNRNCDLQKVQDYLPDINYNTKTFRDNVEIGYRESIGSASPERDSNPKYRNKATENCYEYDLCNAYGQFLKEPIPDLTTIQYNTEVKEGQVGFYKLGFTIEGFPRLCMSTTIGRTCDYVFDLMESPYIKWVNSIISKLKKETDPIRKNKWKNYFRITVGMFQKYNPFLRAIIVEKCNLMILSLRNDSTIYWSTDSIISATKRDDIINNGYEWKIKNQGVFRLGKHLEHQWNSDVPVISGIQKRYIKWYNLTHEKPFILLEDTIPYIKGNLYTIDKNNCQLIVNKESNIYA